MKNEKATPSSKQTRTKEVPPKPPRKIPQGLKQKFSVTTIDLGNGQNSLSIPSDKRIKDFRNNKNDRFRAFQKLCFK